MRVKAAAAPAILNGQAIARAGIVVAILHTAWVARLIPALGRVLDPAPLIRFQGEIAAAGATIAGAKAKVVLAVERTKRAALLAQIEATWGTAMAGMLSENSPLLPQLAAGTAILVGVSLPPDMTLAALPRQAEGEAAGKRFALILIGPVPGMVGGYPGQGFLYEAAAQPGAPVGTTVSVSLPVGSPRAGVVVRGAGLLPLALGAGLPGQEIEGLMAIVILGGLLSSTPLTLLALPGLTARFLKPEHFAGPPEIA